MNQMTASVNEQLAARGVASSDKSNSAKGSTENSPQRSDAPSSKSPGSQMENSLDDKKQQVVQEKEDVIKETEDILDLPNFATQNEADSKESSGKVVEAITEEIKEPTSAKSANSDTSNTSEATVKTVASATSAASTSPVKTISRQEPTKPSPFSIAPAHELAASIDPLFEFLMFAIKHYHCVDETRAVSLETLEFTHDISPTLNIVEFVSRPEHDSNVNLAKAFSKPVLPTKTEARNSSGSLFGLTFGAKAASSTDINKSSVSPPPNKASPNQQESVPMRAPNMFNSLISDSFASLRKALEVTPNPSAATNQQKAKSADEASRSLLSQSTEILGLIDTVFQERLVTEEESKKLKAFVDKGDQRLEASFIEYQESLNNASVSEPNRQFIRLIRECGLLQNAYT